MAGVTDFTGRVAAARDLPELLGAACEAFEVMLTVIRQHDRPGTELFVPMVAAGASAAGGRDHLLFAPSLPPLPFDRPGIGQRGDARMTGRDAAGWLAGVSHVIAARLTAAAMSAGSPGDRDACAGAAACAREIVALMGGRTP